MSDIRMLDIGQVFAARLRQLLEEHDDKQVDLAHYLHVTEATVSRYLRGRLPDDIRILTRIADRYNRPVDWLIGRDLLIGSGISQPDKWIQVIRVAGRLGYTPDMLLQILEALAAVQNAKREG